MEPFFSEGGIHHTRLLVATMACLSLHGIPSRLEARQHIQGGSVTGRVITPGDDFLEALRRGKKLQRYDTHSHSTEPIEPYRLSEVAVIYIETIPNSSNHPPPAQNPALNQHQMVFRPLVLPILAGTTVDFPNNDDLFHNVFSYSQPGQFDLGRYPKGKRKSVTFDEPGIVSVFCDIHSYMFATIIVLDNPFIALPEDDGTFSIAGIPPGAYDLTFWYGRKKIATKKISIEEGRTSTVNFP